MPRPLQPADKIRPLNLTRKRKWETYIAKYP